MRDEITSLGFVLNRMADSPYALPVHSVPSKFPLANIFTAHSQFCPKPAMSAHEHILLFPTVRERRPDELLLFYLNDAYGFVRWSCVNVRECVRVQACQCTIHQINGERKKL